MNFEDPKVQALIELLLRQPPRLVARRQCLKKCCLEKGADKPSYDDDKDYDSDEKKHKVRVLDYCYTEVKIARSQVGELEVRKVE